MHHAAWNAQLATCVGRHATTYNGHYRATHNGRHAAQKQHTALRRITCAATDYGASLCDANTATPLRVGLHSTDGADTLQPRHVTTATYCNCDTLQPRGSVAVSATRCAATQTRRAVRVTLCVTLEGCSRVRFASQWSWRFDCCGSACGTGPSALGGRAKAAAQHGSRSSECSHCIHSAIAIACGRH
jgi:hypothetical protein